MSNTKTKTKKSNYKPVERHSQRKEHPDTFVVGVRVPYEHFTTYKSLSMKQREGLRKHIESYLKTLAE
jgi:hypothetical protein